MASKRILLLLLAIFVLILPSFAIGNHAPHKPTLEFDTSTFNRGSFPKNFIFGTASSAYQVEGAANEGGRGQTNWDAFVHNHPEKIKNKNNADVAVDQYHRYQEDIGIMKDMNVDAYRFSIAWSRILPKGKPSGGVNREGIEYYNKLIDALLAKQIQPYATIFHWDIPQALEDEYGGFLSPHVVEDFRNYAEICFKEFGDRVKHWITLNEPLTFSAVGYAAGDFAPGRCSEWQKRNCTGGDSATEPYLVTHHQLLAHAAAVELYRTKFQASQKGVIGITLNHNWIIPYSDTKADHDAAERCLDSGLGWYMNPLTYGDYPESQKTIVGKRLPKFTPEESKKLKGSIDFLGLNYYTSNYARDAPESNKKHPSYLTDSLADKPFERDGNPIGPRSASSWLYIYPRGIRDLLLYTKEKYNNPIIYITENGMDEEDDATLSLEEALMDTYRIDYYYRHLYYINKAIEKGVRVQGFFAWSTLDNFEWNNGYSKRFGLIYVDYRDNLKRHPKLSARWFKNFLKPQQQCTKSATENF